MKRFDFPLERVRQWRKAQVDVELARLQNLFRDLHGLEEQAARLAGEVSEAGLALQRAAADKLPIDSGQLAWLDDFRLYVRREQQLLARQQDDIRRQIADQRARLIDARRNSRLLDKLRERALETWEKQYARETENTAAELYLAKWKPAPQARL